MPRFNMNWIYILVIAALAFFYFTNDNNGLQSAHSAQKETSYDEFKARVDSGYASKIVINKDTRALKMYVKPEYIREVFNRTPQEVGDFARNAQGRGIRVIIAGAGMAAALPGVIAAETPLPVIGVPIKGSCLEGMDATLAILQMPPGIPVATVAINGAQNAAVLALQIMAVGDPDLQQKVLSYKQGLKKKIVKANEELSQLQYKYKC